MTTGGAYRRFWHQVGETFPDLDGAASTAYYRRNEERLLTDHFGDLRGTRVMKTDLWDEARNTRILAWAAARGASVHGIDLSPPIVRDATRELGRGVLHAAVADVRALPYPDETFDLVYSMGTVEHFDETAMALAEIRRVLKRGGRAIIGVPNRHDPFLRPLLVAVLYRLGLYAYGFEKSYARGRFKELLVAAGFEVCAETGILFIPGWLRMADLAAHAWWRPLTRITGPLVGLFSWIDGRVPRARRHGYLLATVVTRD